MSDILGSQITASINGVSVICDTNATRDNFNPNFTALKRATGTTNSLVGYYPGLADGRFTLASDLYPSVLAGLMGDAGVSGGTITDVGPITVILGFGASGGISLSAKVSSLVLDAQVGQIPTIRLELEAIGPPTEAGAPSAPTSEQPYFFSDVNTSNLIVTSGSSDVTHWTITVTKTNAKKRAFNHSLWPSVIKQATAEVSVSFTMYNVSAAERGAWIAAMAGCPTVADMTFSLTQQCGLTPATNSFTAKDCFYDTHSSQTENGVEGFATETFGAKSNTGKMIAA